MVRRSFRIGLRLGVLIGATFALVKTVQSRRAKPAASPAPWEPIVDKARAETTVVDEVGEPVMEPTAPEPEPEPAPLAGEAGTSDDDLGAPAGTPPEEDLLDAGVQSAPDVDPALDIVADDIVPAARPIRPRRGPARKAAPAKKAAAPTAAAPSWVDPQGGVCPPTHPVKAKLASRLFHLPGMFAYDRTKPDRCYADAPAAEGDGFTAAKR